MSSFSHWQIYLLTMLLIFSTTDIFLRSEIVGYHIILERTKGLYSGISMKGCISILRDHSDEVDKLLFPKINPDYHLSLSAAACTVI